MTEPRYYRWLHEALARDATVITSSRRLARELHLEFAEHQAASGKNAWATPDIYFWQDWLSRSLEELPDSKLPRLIDAASSAVLWEQCLAQTIRDELLSASGLVRHAMRAWQRIHEWQVPLDALAETAASRDEHWFARAADAYAEKLQQSQWLDPAQLPEFCAALIASGSIPAPAELVHAGFDRLTPVLTALFETLQERGSRVDAAPEQERVGEQHLRSYADAAAMWRAAGHWARTLLEREPDARVAVVAPDLEADAVRIARLVREGFAPGWQLAGGSHRASVDVSYGQPLSCYPAIDVAFTVLRLAADGLPSGDVSVLLRTTFLGSEDMAGRSRLDLHLRQLPDRHWQPAALLDTLQAFGKDGDGLAWCERLQAIVALHERREEQQSPASWAKQIDELLATLGWPGTTTPDSAEFQLLNRWRQLLNELAQLQGVRPQLTLPEAVRRLQQVAGDVVYQPEIQAGGLRLLGMLEAAGLEFDYLWVGALDAGRWPPVSNPLALVNRRLQRDYVMPDCTPADTLEFAERRLGRLLRAAITVELSWARLEDDKELIPSPLLDTDSCAVAADVDDPGWQSSADLRAAVRGIDFDNAPPVTDDETIAGGAYTVQHMREEPFRAFAHGRLHTREMDRFQPGLTPILRGTIVHAALQQLFRDKPAQADIQQWDRDARQSRIENACWRALGKHRAHAGPVLQRLLQLEKQRLMQLLDTFIDSECARESFNVEAVEADAVLRQGPVKLKLRIDRIDRLADTSLLIIDYKAGAKKPFMSSKRNAPANVQLCVYARALNDAVGGLTLFYVDSREIAYVGDGGSIPWGKTDVDSWSGILEEWCHEVDVLLARFASGEVGINSEQKHEDARPLAVLSRIAEIDDAS